MIEILQISENGLRANQEWINSISHNVSNMQTPGYKKTITNFGELVNNVPSPNAQLQAGQYNGMGVAVSSSMLSSSHGDIKATGRELDFAIDGNGFLELETENGDYVYTRLGRLSLNEDGRLMSEDGLILSSDIVVPATYKSIQIDASGEVRADLGSGDVVELGKIELVNFASAEHLQPIGNEKYLATERSGQAEKSDDSVEKRIMQGYLEMSNVDLIDEMSDLLLAQRAYQLNARLIQTADQILETINNLRR